MGTASPAADIKAVSRLSCFVASAGCLVMLSAMERRRKLVLRGPRGLALTNTGEAAQSLGSVPDRLGEKVATSIPSPPCLGLALGEARGDEHMGAEGCTGEQESRGDRGEDSTGVGSLGERWCRGEIGGEETDRSLGKA